ncbi:hypothetical protein [Tropicibacter naphthalenivorans]|uniref:Lipoprotein n=1 Tax=Tropicibacter naphthalenivorans TaxID=441103 RepID=A0A0P1G6K6_9RHOB|nr:hypothetical protein [Tropicibacter naphthalenivorans]CUH77372.1 hypothetical protein TRN7648_01439 [Tropicibacter naphthalenivorans]SMC58517.1 hypothetical protein SAMN04488093_102178 [Tropicibacter naphthalenivorans]
MKKALSVLVVSSVVLTSCGAIRDSAMNPFNWFGRSTSEAVATGAEVNPLIPARRSSVFRSNQPETYQGWAVGEVTELLVERRPGGAVIRATAVADRQGAFEVRLVKNDEESDADTLTYDFRAIQQPGNVGTALSRQVTAAVWLTDNELRGIRTIRVKAARNVRTARR